MDLTPIETVLGPDETPAMKPKRRSIKIEKIVWNLMFLLSICGCLYMISEIWSKYRNSPIVITFATEATPLFEIPFPAVTICPQVKLDKSIFNYEKVYRQFMDNPTVVAEQDLKKLRQFHLICDANEDLVNVSQEFEDNSFLETVNNIKPNIDTLLPQCYFANEFQYCSDMLTPILLDDGICYSFNLLNRNDIYRENVFQFEDLHLKNNMGTSSYDIENGYWSNEITEIYPKRAVMPETDYSLKILLNYNPNDAEFLCKANLEGHRLLIHNPWDVPRVSKHHLRIPFDKSIRFALSPHMVTTSGKVRKFSPDNRKCYMADERFLKYFKFYTQANCLLECLTNITLEQCGCVAFYMPRDNYTKICGRSKDDCISEAEYDLSAKDRTSLLAEQRLCDCKPSCTNLGYNIETSYTEFHHVIDDGSHWTLIEIYFKQENFVATVRNELYDVLDLISNFGGILGLFTGLSLLSLGEIIYSTIAHLYYRFL